MSDDLFGELGRGNDQHGVCPECGRDCSPEVLPASEGMRVVFSCPMHGAHALIDPFED